MFRLEHCWGVYTSPETKLREFVHDDFGNLIEQTADTQEQNMFCLPINQRDFH